MQAIECGVGEAPGFNEVGKPLAGIIRPVDAIEIERFAVIARWWLRWTAFR
jgi:hypothetical protein